MTSRRMKKRAASGYVEAQTERAVMDTPELMFVYGTLRKDTATAMSRLLACHCAYVSGGLLQGRLYDVGGYPGVVGSDTPGENVVGDLYRIIDRDVVLPRLDEYEHCTQDFPEPHEYLREKRPVTLPDGESVTAWVYLYNHDTAKLKHLQSGDYFDHRLSECVEK